MKSQVPQKQRHWGHKEVDDTKLSKKCPFLFSFLRTMNFNLRTRDFFFWKLNFCSPAEGDSVVQRSGQLWRKQTNQQVEADHCLHCLPAATAFIPLNILLYWHTIYFFPSGCVVMFCCFFCPCKIEILRWSQICEIFLKILTIYLQILTFFPLIILILLFQKFNVCPFNSKLWLNMGKKVFLD